MTKRRVKRTKIQSPGLFVVDPGIEFGWAFFPRGSRFPTECGVCIPRAKDYFDRAAIVASEVTSIVESFADEHIDEFAIEWPGFFSDSAGGNTCANSGALVKLAYIVGRIEGGFVEGMPHANKIHHVAVNHWKGQLWWFLIDVDFRHCVDRGRWHK